MNYLDGPPTNVLDGEPPAYTVPRRKGLHCRNCGKKMLLTTYGLECPSCPAHAGGRFVFLAVDPIPPDSRSDLENAAQDLDRVIGRRFGLRRQRPHGRPSSRGKPPQL